MRYFALHGLEERPEARADYFRVRRFEEGREAGEDPGRGNVCGDEVFAPCIDFSGEIWIRRLGEGERVIWWSSSSGGGGGVVCGCHDPGDEGGRVGGKSVGLEVGSAGKEVCEGGVEGAG